MKKVLILASVASMISQFNMDNIYLLKELGFEVHVACNFIEGNTCDKKNIEGLKDLLQKIKVPFFQVDFSRNIKKISRNLNAYQQVEILVKANDYVFIHCHSPIGGVIGRIVGVKTNVKCIYTAHGFHFYKGAGIKNWVLFFPIEKILSFFTDVLITINQEDYDFAYKYLKAKKIEFVPGIGINTKKIKQVVNPSMREKVRKDLDVDENTIVLFSIGELSSRKNHETVIRALSILSSDITQEFRYYIAGIGKLEGKLKTLALKMKIAEKVRFLGYRTDIAELLAAADIFVFPSFQEGLPVALMEAMGAGLPIICSDIRGNRDLIYPERGGLLVSPDAVKEWGKDIEILLMDKSKMASFGEYNKKVIEEFSVESVRVIMKKIYMNFL